MRAFITGFSTTQCLGRDSVLGIITLPVALADALPALGYDVRVGRPGEYDGEELVFMGLMTPKSFTTRLSWDCMNLWDRVRRDYVTLVPFFDDWQLGTFMTQLWGLREGSGNVPYDAKKHERLNHRDETGPFDPVVVRRFIDWVNYAPYHFVWPRIDVGDRDQLTRLIKNPSARPLDLDPSNLVVPYPGYNGEHKYRTWVLAALKDYTEWVTELEETSGWRIEDYGHRKSTMGRVTEAELQEIMNRSWGVLTPRYSHAGSGWWRVRYLMSAWAQSIIVPPDDERGLMGPSYDIDMADVEALSDAQRRDLALAQVDDLRRVTKNREEALIQLQAVIDQCMDDRGINYDW